MAHPMNLESPLDLSETNQLEQHLYRTDVVFSNDPANYEHINDIHHPLEQHYYYGDDTCQLILLTLSDRNQKLFFS